MGWLGKHARFPDRRNRAQALRSILPASLAFFAAVSNGDATFAFQQPEDRVAQGAASPLVELDILRDALFADDVAKSLRPRARLTYELDLPAQLPKAPSAPAPSSPKVAKALEAKRPPEPVELGILRDALFAGDGKDSSRPRPKLTYELDFPESAPAPPEVETAATTRSRAAGAGDATNSNIEPVAPPALPDPGSLLVPCPDVIPPPSGTYPIDLATALRLADSANPTIGAARTLILESLAQQLQARTLLLPSLNGGASYRGHNGILERVSGKTINVSSQSLYLGAGAFAVGSGTVAIPGVNVSSPLTDAWFEPLAARQRVAEARFGAEATSLDILLDVAVLHLELLGNQSILEVQRRSEAEFHEVYRLTKDYAEAGEGREADAHRALAQWKRRRALVQKAEEELAVTAARLARRLNLDPAVRLEPIGGPLVPLTLIALDTPQMQLIKVALQRRPDIQARTAAVGEADVHVKQEIGRPLLPTLWLGFSGGSFGGGSNLVPPLMGNFASRSDFDVDLYWTVQNFGAGNLALIKQRRAQVAQADAERARTINRARDEVSQSLAQAHAADNEIQVARNELATAELAFKEDLDRTRFRGGEKPRDVLPIELLNSLDLLAAARVNLVRSLVRYDQSQYRLWVSLGSPPPLASD